MNAITTVAEKIVVFGRRQSTWTEVAASYTGTTLKWKTVAGTRSGIFRYGDARCLQPRTTLILDTLPMLAFDPAVNIPKRVIPQSELINRSGSSLGFKPMRFSLRTQGVG